MEWLWLLLLGLGTGSYGVMVGAGGGVILVPMLLLFFDVEARVIAGTSLAMVALNTVAGAASYRRQGLVDRRSGLLFAAAAIPGSVIAPFAVKGVAGGTFRVLLGLLLVGLAVYMLVRPRPAGGATGRSRPPAAAAVTSRRIVSGSGQVFEYRFNEALAVSFNVLLGFISAFFGTGGGFVRTPVLVTAFSFPVRVAVATSVFALSIYATVGALVHASLGHVDWYPTFVWAGIGLVAGGQIGARLATRFRGRWILRLLLVVVLALGIRLVVEGIRG